MEKLKNELHAFGLELDGIPILDGNFQRVKYQGSKDNRGFYVGHIVNGQIYATYGTWEDRGSDKKYCSLSGSESINDHVFNQIYEQRKKEQEEGYKKTAEKAALIIDKALICENHPYVSKKKIKPFMPITDEFNRLIISVIDSDGHISSLQYISEKGDKQFLYNGKIKDCCHIIQGNKNKICICEGWATGWSIHEATGFFTVVAFNEGNLEGITKIVKKKYPLSEIILCADNDHKKKKNIGLERCRSIIEKQPEITLRFPSGIKGTDFNDMAVEKGIESVKAVLLDEPIICTAQDITEEIKNNSTIFPECLYKDKGLISLGLQAISEWSGSDILQYNLPVVLIHIAASIAGKTRCGSYHPSFLFVKLGHTSTGKTEADKAIINKISERLDLKKQEKDHDGNSIFVSKIYGASDIASGPGFLRGVQKQNLSLIMLDEISYLFTRYGGSFDSNTAGKIKEILEISTSPGRERVRPYGDGKTIKIDYPVINLMGNAPIKKIFSSFVLDDLSSGLIPRFFFFCYDGPIPYRKGHNYESDAGYQFIDKLSELKNMRDVDMSQIKTSSDLMKQAFDNNAVDVGLTPGASELACQYSIQSTDRQNKEDDDGLRGIISRQYEATFSFALVHAAAIRDIKNIYEPLTVTDLEWGRAITDILIDWKLNILVKNISAGNFDTLCKVFLEAAKSCIKQGKKPSGKIMIHRRPALKNLTSKQWDEVVRVLKARGQIIIKEEKKTLYYPINEKDV